MKRSVCLVSTLLGLILFVSLAGCQSGELHVLKTRGIYTTLAPSAPELDLPGEAYRPMNAFGAGQTPSAIVVGYGSRGRQEAVSMELVELGTGHALWRKDYYASYGKAVVQPLIIRRGGDYKVRLLVNGSEYDSYQFHVDRGGAAQGRSVAGADGYSQGLFSATLRAERPLAGFDRYDSAMLQSIMASLHRVLVAIKADAIAPRRPGKVVIAFRLDERGGVAETELLQDTLEGGLAGIFQGVLMQGAPYGVWPPEARQELGAGSRRITVTFFLD